MAPMEPKVAAPAVSAGVLSAGGGATGVPLGSLGTGAGAMGVASWTSDEVEEEGSSSASEEVDLGGAAVEEVSVGFSVGFSVGLSSPPLGGFSQSF